MNNCKRDESTNNIGQPRRTIPTVAEISEAIVHAMPAFIARYISHQMKVCNQREEVIIASFRRYLGALQSLKPDHSQNLTAGDLWSGLLWWRDETSWVGSTGVFSFAEVCQLARRSLLLYFAMYDAGFSQDAIVCRTLKDQNTSQLGTKLLNELVTDNGAPGFRAIVTYAVKELWQVPND